MSDDLVKRADEALKDVTPGPWCVGPADDTTVSSFGYGDVSQTLGNYGSPSDWPRMEANARFIAAARELVPAMRARIEGDAKRIAELKADFNRQVERTDEQRAAYEARIAELVAALREIEVARDLENPCEYNRGWNASRSRLRAIARAALEGEKT